MPGTDAVANGYVDYALDSSQGRHRPDRPISHHHPGRRSAGRRPRVWPWLHPTIRIPV